MPRPMPWFERRFPGDYPLGAAPGLVERLRGTPARLEELVRDVPHDALVRRVDGRWSIQEHAGHLGDLEPLWYARVDDFLAGRDPLTTADLTNRRTHDANHNARPLRELLTLFRGARRRLVERLESLAEADWGRTSTHPRLGTTMRLVDHALFVAEHDDHHLAEVVAGR